MATISAAMVKQLREKAGAGIMDCKEALAECDGDISKSIDFLRKKGLAIALKRSGRVMSEGIIKSYIHTGSKLGVLVEIDCETDFVAKNDGFIEFAKNIAMHIAATNPVGIRPEDVPKEIINKEKEIYRAQALRDPNVTVDDLLNGLIAKIGENITIKRFVRFQVGES